MQINNSNSGKTLYNKSCLVGRVGSVKVSLSLSAQLQGTGLLLWYHGQLRQNLGVLIPTWGHTKEIFLGARRRISFLPSTLFLSV